MKSLVRKCINQLGFDVVKIRHSNNSLEDHLRNVLAQYQIDCVIDVGANAGQYGQYLRSIGYKGWIVSYEPVQAVFERLEQGCRQDSKWECYRLALGDTNDTKTINVYSSTVFSSFLQANEYAKNIWHSLEQQEQENVSVVRLDSIFEEQIGRLGVENCYLKLDTQGYDKLSFQGATGCLDKIKAMQTELSLIPIYEAMPEAYDTLNQFHQAGFLISGMYPINRDESLAVIEYDCVLIKK